MFLGKPIFAQNVVVVMMMMEDGWMGLDGTRNAGSD